MYAIYYIYYSTVTTYSSHQSGSSRFLYTGQPPCISSVGMNTPFRPVLLGPPAPRISTGTQPPLR